MSYCNLVTTKQGNVAKGNIGSLILTEYRLIYHEYTEDTVENPKCSQIFLTMISNVNIEKKEQKDSYVLLLNLILRYNYI